MDCWLVKGNEIESIIVIGVGLKRKDFIGAKRIQQEIATQTGKTVPVICEDELQGSLLDKNLVLLGTDSKNTLSGQVLQQANLEITPDITGKEGYIIHVGASPVRKGKKAVVVGGNTNAGTLYGAFHLPRHWIAKNNSISILDNLTIVNKPSFSIRGIVNAVILRPYRSWSTSRLGDDPFNYIGRSIDDFWMIDFEEYIDYLTYLGINAITFTLQPQMDDYLLYASQKFTDLVNPVLLNKRENLFSDIITYAHERNIKCFAYVDLGHPSSVLKKHYPLVMGKDRDGKEMICASDPVLRKIKKDIISEILEVFPQINGIIMEHEGELCVCDKCKGSEKPWADLVNEIDEILVKKGKELVLYSMSWVRKYLHRDIIYLTWWHRKFGYRGMSPEMIKYPRQRQRVPDKLPGILAEKRINAECRRRDKICWMPVVEQFAWEGTHLAFVKTIKAVAKVSWENQLDGLWSWGPLWSWFNVLPGIIAQGLCSWNAECSEDDIWKEYHRQAMRRYGRQQAETMQKIFELIADACVHDNYEPDEREALCARSPQKVIIDLKEASQLLEKLISTQTDSGVQSELKHTRQIIQSVICRCSPKKEVE